MQALHFRRRSCLGSVVAGDTNDAAKQTNTRHDTLLLTLSPAELQKRMRDDEVLAEKRAQQRADAQSAAVLSGTQRWNNLRAAVGVGRAGPCRVHCMTTRGSGVLQLPGTSSAVTDMGECGQVLQKRMQAAAAMGCQETQQWSDLEKAASMCLHC